MLARIHAWLMRHTNPVTPMVDPEIADLAGLNGYPAEIAAVKRTAEKRSPAGKKKSRHSLRVVG